MTQKEAEKILADAQAAVTELYHWGGCVAPMLAQARFCRCRDEIAEALNTGRRPVFTLHLIKQADQIRQLAAR